MTKQWDQYEETIKALYADHTLAQVRQIMTAKYNFNASTRAYRGRLIKWDVRKYNCRRHGQCKSNASPVIGTSNSPAHWSTTDLCRYSEPNASNLSSGPYDHRCMNTYQKYPEGISILPEWIAPPVQSAASIPTFSRADMPDVSRPMSGSSPISATSSGYSSAPNTPSSAPNFYTTMLYAPAGNTPSQAATNGYPPILCSPIMYGTPQADRDRRSSAPQTSTTTHNHHHHHHQYGIVGPYDSGPPLPATTAAPYHGAAATATATVAVYSPLQDAGSSPDPDNIVYHPQTTTTAQGTIPDHRMQ